MATYIIGHWYESGGHRSRENTLLSFMVIIYRSHYAGGHGGHDCVLPLLHDRCLDGVKYDSHGCPQVNKLAVSIVVGAPHRTSSIEHRASYNIEHTHYWRCGRRHSLNIIKRQSNTSRWMVVLYKCRAGGTWLTCATTFLIAGNYVIHPSC